MRTVKSAAVREVMTVIVLAAAGLAVVALATLGPYAWAHRQDPPVPGVAASTSPRPQP